MSIPAKAGIQEILRWNSNISHRFRKRKPRETSPALESTSVPLILGISTLVHIGSPWRYGTKTGGSKVHSHEPTDQRKDTEGRSQAQEIESCAELRLPSLGPCGIMVFLAIALANQ